MVASRAGGTRMGLGGTTLVRSKGSCRLLKIITRAGAEVYAVVGGNGPTTHFEDYEDARDELNLRWMREQFGD
jgi:hypothetical protein